MNRLPGTPFRPWRASDAGVVRTPKPVPKHDVEAGAKGLMPTGLDDSGQAEHVAGEVLVVVAMDVLRVHRGRRDVVERDAGDRADFPTLCLELVKQGRHDRPSSVTLTPLLYDLTPLTNSAALCDESV